MHRAPPKPHGAATSHVATTVAMVSLRPVLWSIFSARPTPAFSGGQGRPKAEQCPSVCNGLFGGHPLVPLRPAQGLLGFLRPLFPSGRRPSQCRPAGHCAAPSPAFTQAAAASSRGPNCSCRLHRRSGPERPELAPTGGAEGANMGAVQPDVGPRQRPDFRLNLQASLAPGAEPRPATEPRRSRTERQGR